MEILTDYPPTCGLTELKPKEVDDVRVFAYNQKGGWCWSNSGVVYSVKRNEVTLIDVLTDPKQTEKLLQQVDKALPGAKLKTLVLTHCDVDHIGGFQLVQNMVEEVYAAKGCEDAMKAFYQSRMGVKVKLLHHAWRILDNPLTRRAFGGGDTVPRWLAKIAMAPLFDPFAWDKVSSWREISQGKFVTSELQGQRLTINEHVTLITVNVSSHSDHDLVAEVGGVRFVGDILFNGITPLIWSGTIHDALRVADDFGKNWDGFIVPGHGAIQHSFQKPFETSAGYWRNLLKVYEDKGQSEFTVSVLQLLPSVYRKWEDPERTLINLWVHELYENNPGAKVNKLGLIAKYMSHRPL